MSDATDEASRAFKQAKSMLTGSTLQGPMVSAEDARNYASMAGMSYIAYGLYNLTDEINDLSRELAEVKSLAWRARLPGR